MSRFGVMKHLRQLEEAGLVVTRRRGREKLHFLNPVPIRLVHDRWVSKYAEPWVAGLSYLKQRLESTMEKVFEIYIRTTPERLWEAITDPGLHRWLGRLGALNADGTAPLRALAGGWAVQRSLGAGRRTNGPAACALSRPAAFSMVATRVPPWRRSFPAGVCPS